MGRTPATVKPARGCELVERVAARGLADVVRFAGPSSREELARRAWEEPFGLTGLEAFSAGVPVLGTCTGGSGEILRDAETGTVFRATVSRRAVTSASG